MDANSLKKLKRKIYIIFPLSFIILTSLVILPAGTLKYWQGWLFCSVIFICALFVTIYFLKRSPEFLERRIKFKEKEAEQKTIIKIANLFCFAGLIIPGLDYRLGWSTVPFWLVVTANVAILVSYFLVFLSFKENAFAGRTVEVFKGQKVIDTGPYAVVRHPMYSGMIPMFLLMSLALGSFWGIIVFVPACIVIIFRLLNEEKVLRRDLPGYKEYCQKVRYRLVPYVW